MRTRLYQHSVPADYPQNNPTYSTFYANSGSQLPQTNYQNHQFDYTRTSTVGYYNNNNVAPAPALNYNLHPNTLPNSQPEFPRTHEMFTPTHYNPYWGKKYPTNATTTANQPNDGYADSLPQNPKSKGKAKATKIIHSPLSKHIGIFEAENSKVTKPVLGGYKYGSGYTTPTSSEGQRNENMFDNMSLLSDYNWKGGYPPGCTPTSQELADNNATPPPLDNWNGSVNTPEGTPQHRKNASQSAARNTSTSKLYANITSNAVKAPSPPFHDGRNSRTVTSKYTPTSAYYGGTALFIEKTQPERSRANSKPKRKTKRKPRRKKGAVPADPSTPQPADKNTDAPNPRLAHVLGQSTLVEPVFRYQEPNRENFSPTVKSEASPGLFPRFALDRRPHSAYYSSDARSPKMELGFICHKY
ncbi:hypothetical protein F4811DRAFT_571900 [Daldinia bambusicola]|nr:hypothetical protein F4811DRAFT_571900 [Daldinia bambusicola]